MVRRILTVVAILALAPLGLAAQTGGEGDPRGVGETRLIEVNDIRVILSPADNDIVSIIVGLDGGYVDGLTQNPILPEVTAGVIASGGSSSYDKNSLRRFLSRTSTRLDGSADRLGIRFSVTATRSRFPEAWTVLSSILRDPLYDSIEFRNEIQRQTATVRRAFTNPEGQAYRIADSLVKMSHPLLGRYTYEADVAGVTMQSVRTLFGQLRERSRMLVVVVGNVTESEIRTMLADFSSWPDGDYERPEVPSLEVPEEPSVVVVNRQPLPTTYVYGMFTGPESGEEGSWPLAIGMSYLRGVLFEEIRTKRNLSYAPFAYTSSGYGLGTGIVGVSSVHPDSSAAIILHEIERMKRGEFTDEELESAKQVYITRFYMGEMTNGAKANRLYYNERYAGDWSRAFAYDDIRSVNRDDVEDAFEEYARNIQFGVVGDASQVKEETYRMGD